MALAIRHALPADAAAIARVHVASWQAAYAGLMPEEYLAALSVAQRRRMWEDILSESGRAQFPVFVATDNGRIVGFCSFGTAEGDSGGAGEVYAIYLLPEYLGKGAGHALFDAALTALKHAGFQQAVLWVLEGNDRAVRFYEAHGWASDGARKETERGGVVTRELRYRTAITHSA